MASCRNVQDMYKGERMNIHCINSEYLKYMEYITATQHVSSQVAENIHMSYSTHVKINPFHIRHSFKKQYTRSVRKVSDLWPGKRNWLTWSVGHPITLKVVPLGLHTLLPAVPPLLEACRKSLFRNGV